VIALNPVENYFFGSLTENHPMTMPAPQVSPDAKNMANIIYILYIIGFFTGITALIGVVLAYINRNQFDPASNSHFNRQIKIFWRGVIFAIFIFITYFIGAITIILMPIAWILMLWWFIWTVIAIARGMSALNRSQPIAV
jgi:uncharacterized membrane protein